MWKNISKKKAGEKIEKINIKLNNKAGTGKWPAFALPACGLC